MNKKTLTEKIYVAVANSKRYNKSHKKEVDEKLLVSKIIKIMSDNKTKQDF